jgi:Na+/melibiose symporter-like transporter
MAGIIAAICGGGMLSAFLATPSHTGAAAPEAPALKGALPALWANKPFLKLILAYVLQLTGVGLISAIAPYWITDVAGRDEGQVGVALGFLLLFTIASTPLWAIVIRRIGARATSAAAAFLYGLATLTFLALPPQAPTVMVFGVFALAGVPFAGIQIGPFALAAHLIHEAADASGVRREGLFTGLWTAGEKVGLALGPGVAGLGLMLVGFKSGAAQTPATIHGINLLVALTPPAFLWLSLLLLGAPKAKQSS